MHRLKKPYIIGGVIVLIVTVAIAALTFIPNSPLSRLFGGPQMLVAGRPFLFACTALTPNDLASTFSLQRNNNEAIFEISAMEDGQHDTDLLNDTGKDSIRSGCRYGLNISTSSDGPVGGDTFQVVLTQYRDTNAASQSAAQLKPQQGTQELPSFKRRGANYFAIEQPTEESPHPTAQASLVKDNVEIYLEASLQKTTNPDEYVQKLDAAMRSVVGRIDSGEAAKPTSFNGLYQLNGKKSVDACKTLDIPKLSQEMGAVEFNTSGVQDSLIATTSDPNANENMLESACVMRFRTPKDKQAQQGKTIPSDEEASGYDRQFAQGLSFVSTFYEDAERASHAVKNLRETASAQDVALGDTAVKQHQDDNQTGYTTDIYYIQKGQSLYRITFASITQQTPFVSEGYTVSDELAAKVYNHLQKQNE